MRERDDDDHYVDEPVADYIERKKAEGCTVETPKPNELFIDIDTSEQLTRFGMAMDRMRQDFPGISFESKTSKSGFPHIHFKVKMPWDMDHVERIAWQAVFGSDPIRELLALLRVRRGEEIPTLFVN